MFIFKKALLIILCFISYFLFQNQQGGPPNQNYDPGYSDPNNQGGMGGHPPQNMGGPPQNMGGPGPMGGPGGMMPPPNQPFNDPNQGMGGPPGGGPPHGMGGPGMGGPMDNMGPPMNDGGMMNQVGVLNLLKFLNYSTDVFVVRKQFFFVMV